jgi:hypothetical protein
VTTEKEFYTEYYGGPVKSCPLEKVEQVNSCSFLRFHHPEILGFHPVNESGAGGSAQYGRYLNEAGRLNGTSDWIILHQSASGKHPGAVVDIKRIGKSQSSPVDAEQVDFFRRAKAAGYYTAVCYGAEQFKLFLHDYVTVI